MLGLGRPIKISTNGAFTVTTSSSSPGSTVVPATPISATTSPLTNGSPRSLRTNGGIAQHRRFPSGQHQHFPSHPHPHPHSYAHTHAPSHVSSSPKSAASSSAGGHDGHDRIGSGEFAASGSSGGAAHSKLHSSPRHRPRLSQSHTAPALPPVAEGSAGGGSPELQDRPPSARPRLRTVSSSSTLLGLGGTTHPATGSALGGNGGAGGAGGVPYLSSDPQLTPLAPPAPIYEATSSSTTGLVPTGGGQGPGAIGGYPFPPVGDVTVPGGGGGGGDGGPSAIGSDVPLTSGTVSSFSSAAGPYSSARTFFGATSTASAERNHADDAAPVPSRDLVPRALDYSVLSSRGAVQDELESTLLEMASWLELVSDGLGRVVHGQVDLGVDLVALSPRREGEGDGGTRGPGPGVIVGARSTVPVPLPVSAA